MTQSLYKINSVKVCEIPCGKLPSNYYDKQLAGDRFCESKQFNICEEKLAGAPCPRVLRREVL